VQTIVAREAPARNAQWRMPVRAAWALAALGGCFTSGPAPFDTAARAPAIAAAGGETTRSASSRPSAGSARLLTREQARRYMVELINRDRASAGLHPVELDEGAAGRAGQIHADDMASHGYLGHWGSDGSVPEQRYTDAGGTDMVLENASCFTDERNRVLDSAPRIDAKNVELAEGMFFNERPPADGHRRNILKPWHGKVGIGVAQPVATPTDIPVPCFAQEFVDSYGSYGPVPRTMRLGATLRVEGSIEKPATFAGIGLARVEAPKPIEVHELNRRRSYPVPAPYQTYWPAGYQTPIAVKVAGGRFAIDLPVSDRDRSGMYEVSIWASFPGSQDFIMVSLRTIQVR